MLLFINSSLYSQKAGDAYVLKINNITLPLTNSGVIADVIFPEEEIYGGEYDDHIFLYSSGFILSGKTNEEIWSKKNKPVNIIGAYIVGRGNDALGSVTEAKKIASSLRSVFENNFITSVKNNSDKILSYKLEQNYPNPFNPITIITISCSKMAKSV